MRGSMAMPIVKEKTLLEAVPLVAVVNPRDRTALSQEMTLMN